MRYYNMAQKYVLKGSVDTCHIDQVAQWALDKTFTVEEYETNEAWRTSNTDTCGEETAVLLDSGGNPITDVNGEIIITTGA